MFTHTRPPKGAKLIEANPINRTEVNSSNQNLRKQAPSTDQKATVKPCKGVLGLAPAKTKWVLGLALAILRKCLSWVLGLALAILRCWVLGLALAILRCWVLGLALPILRKCLGWVLGLALAILRCWVLGLALAILRCWVLGLALAILRCSVWITSIETSKQEEKSPDKVTVSWQPSEMWSVETFVVQQIVKKSLKRIWALYTSKSQESNDMSLFHNHNMQQKENEEEGNIRTSNCKLNNINSTRSRVHRIPARHMFRVGTRPYKWLEASQRQNGSWVLKFSLIHGTKASLVPFGNINCGLSNLDLLWRSIQPGWRSTRRTNTHWWEFYMFVWCSAR